MRSRAVHLLRSELLQDRVWSTIMFTSGPQSTAIAFLSSRRCPNALEREGGHRFCFVEASELIYDGNALPILSATALP